jgi:SPP1 family predicted phage head-tail adaptor
MRTGQLDRRVRLEGVVSTTRTPSGNVKPVWGTMAVAWASRRDTLGTERVQLGAEVTTADSVFRIRWHTGMSTAQRLIEINTDGGPDRQWDVLAVAELGRREWLDLTCRRVHL